MSDKDYKSIFATGLEIDVANYITELFIRNYMLMKRQSLPTCAFWKKDVAAAHPNLGWLQKKYQDELPEVKKLLRVFSAAALAEELNKNQRLWWTIRYLKKDQRKDLYYNLVLIQMKLSKQAAEAKATPSMDGENFTSTKSRRKTKASL